uniref:RING-CH-type domain-containing protein n=1 Tax=Opuntia streptacantha TaxID=393608 RepID=A0A7C9D812_OPUST
MATLMASHIDIEQGIPHRCSAGSVASSDSDDESLRCSDEKSSSDEAEIVGGAVGTEKGRRSSSSSSSSSCVYESSAEEVVDLESGGGGVVAETKVSVSVHSVKVERDCRICHLSLDASNPESGLPIELGCSCKDDLAAAHKQCAEAWFKIRGNKTCEICGSTARNVVGVNEVEMTEQWNETNETAATTGAPPHPVETRHFWQGHRFLNFLLACMVFAFVISWLFHFNVPS